MAKKITFETRHFKHERVWQAIALYRQALQRLQGTDDQAYALLEEHKLALEQDVNELRTLHHEAQKITSAAARGKKRQLINRQIATLNRVITDIDDSPDLLISNLREHTQSIAGELDKISFDAQGKLACEYLEEMYAGKLTDTSARYLPMDRVHDVDIKYACRFEDAADRAYEMALVPKPLRHAKWELMLALSDAAYNITLQPKDDDKADAIHRKLLSRLLSRLSMNERGATNPLMAYSHKPRHNPAIHSLNTVALNHKIFEGGREKIISASNGHKNNRLIEWQKLRDRTMRIIERHDLGEMDGELDVGSERARMSPAYAAEFADAVKNDEKATFLRHLDRQRKALAIDAIAWQKIREENISLFDEAGKTDYFVGRYCKALENIQTMQDYLRYEGRDGAPLLKDADEKSKRFSLDYVSRSLRHAAYDDKNFGPKALRNLVHQISDPDKKFVCQSLTDVLEQEYDRLMDNLVKAFASQPAVKINSRTVGM